MVRQYVGAGKKVFEFLKPKPKVNKTKLDTAKSNLAIAIQKGKAANAKLKQTQFEIANPEFKGKEFTFAKSNKKTESNKEAYKRIQKQNTKALKSMVDEAFNNVDFILTPTTPIISPKLGSKSITTDGLTEPVGNAMTRFTSFFNMTGHPALSLPSGLHSEGLPMGVQLIGPHFNELQVLILGKLIEQKENFKSLKS